MDQRTLLALIPLFETLDEGDIATLAGKLDERTVAAGGVIFSEGEAGASLFLIEEGVVDISVGEGKSRVQLASLVPGQYFGELSLLDGKPRSATAVAQKQTRLFALDRDDFVSFVKEKPLAAVAIVAELGERLRATNSLFVPLVSKNVLAEEEEKLTFGQRIADRVASFGGSWTFIGVFCGGMAVWMAMNVLGLVDFDPFPFILLNLALSTTAALQAPVIMMSQNRQASKDKLLSQNDFRVNLKAELGIQELLKGQAELLARVALLERAGGGFGRPTIAPTASPRSASAVAADDLGTKG